MHQLFLLSSNDSISRKNVVFLANHKLGTVYRRTVLQFQGYDKKLLKNYVKPLKFQFNQMANSLDWAMAVPQ